MEIVRVLNNNVVVAREGRVTDSLFIAMGKGIGFQKRKGDFLREEQVENYFTLADRDLYENFKKLVKSIDNTSIELAENIINYAQNTFPTKKFNDIIHIALADHINGVIERQKKGCVLNNAIWTEVKRIYREEFAIGFYAVQQINQRFGYDLGNDEAAFIAVHFVNAQSEGTSPDVERVSRLIADITAIVKNYFEFTPDEDSIDYYRFVEHIKVISRCVFEPGRASESDSGIYDFIAEKFPDVRLCADKIERVFVLKYGCQLPKDDKAYLIMYIERLVRQ